MSMSPAEVTATRTLIGLSISELAEQLGVARSTIYNWEKGEFSPRETLATALDQLRARHDETLDQLAAYYETEGGIIGLPAGPMPRGWYQTLGARLLDRYPDVMLDWVG